MRRVRLPEGDSGARWWDTTGLALHLTGCIFWTSPRITPGAIPRRMVPKSDWSKGPVGDILDVCVRRDARAGSHRVRLGRAAARSVPRGTDNRSILCAAKWIVCTSMTSV